MKTYVQAYSVGWLDPTERHSFCTVEVESTGGKVLFNSRWHRVRDHVLHGKHILHDGLRFRVVER
jgi:hypothetical protein